jgi:hypothetical protein
MLNQSLDADGLELLTRGLCIDGQTQGVYRLLCGGFGFELVDRTDHCLAILLGAVDLSFVPPEDPYCLT